MRFGSGRSSGDAPYVFSGLGAFGETVPSGMISGSAPSAILSRVAMFVASLKLLARAHLLAAAASPGVNVRYDPSAPGTPRLRRNLCAQASSPVSPVARCFTSVAAEQNKSDRRLGQHNNYPEVALDFFKRGSKRNRVATAHCFHLEQFAVAGSVVSDDIDAASIS
jgi:hypothetical protein